MEPQFVEHPNGRLYEVIVVSGYPSNHEGHRGCCHVDHDGQRVEISAHVPEHRRPHVIAEALTGVSGYRLVPVRGPVS